MQNDVLVRIAVEDDLPGITKIYNDAILHTTAVYAYKTQTVDERKVWFRQKISDQFPVFVAESNGEVIGFSTIGPFRAWPAYKYSVENSVYVDQRFRGKGVGKQLIQPLIESAGLLEKHAILAGIDSTNEASIRLHQSFGFQEVACFKEVGYKFGRWLDLKFLQLILATPSNPTDY
jgi:L-amino acid N-acyltransferase YncA